MAKRVRDHGCELPDFKIGRLFMAFIFACGLTHLLGALVFWFPIYRLEGGMLWATAIISLATSQVLAARVEALARTLADALHLQDRLGAADG
jgi:hypothetical protein